jgi:hypothetical protein
LSTNWLSAGAVAFGVIGLLVTAYLLLFGHLGIFSAGALVIGAFFGLLICAGGSNLEQKRGFSTG